MHRNLVPLHLAFPQRQTSTSTRAAAISPPFLLYQHDLAHAQPFIHESPALKELEAKAAELRNETRLRIYRT
jgi:hypothetical protein